MTIAPSRNETPCVAQCQKPGFSLLIREIPDKILREFRSFVALGERGKTTRADLSALMGTSGMLLTSCYLWLK